MKVGRVALPLIAVGIVACSLSSDPELHAKPTVCPAGAKLCGEACVSVGSADYGCASDSCEPCASSDHLPAICVSGECGLGPCDSGWGDCDGASANGCETDLTTTTAHCGACFSPCLGANTVPTEATCSDGQCQLSCVSGFDDCDLDPTNGCESELAVDPSHCGGCGHPCGEHEICSEGGCVSDDPTLAWLASQTGGWCLEDHDKLVNLCGKVSYCSWTLCGDLDDEAPETGDPATSSNCYSDLGHEHDRAVPFCCDPAYFRSYPDGAAVDVGFHYDGIAVGRLLAVGGDTAGNAIAIVLPEPGRIKVGMFFSDELIAPLTAGTHLVSARVTADEIALHIDGVLVATGAGTAESAELQAAYGPGFVLGSRISYWWEEATTLRFAPFLVHLRDSVVDPTIFSLSEVVEAGPSTIVLFDEQGVAGNAWNATSGAGVGYAISNDVGGPDGAWVSDVWASCL